MKKLALFLFPPLILIAACSGPVKGPQYESDQRPMRGADVERLLNGALQHIGEPYRYGGISSRGWDCSGFVYGMFLKYLDTALPRDTKGLYSASFSVQGRHTRAGDLVFFRIDSAKPTHVGIYMGKNRFIHASTSAGVVVSKLTEDYYRKRFMGYRRIRGDYLANNR